MKKVICDCDNTMGFQGRPMDDALAILYLLGSSEDIELLGITCNFGNGTVAESVESNTKMLQEIGYTEIPVYAGSDQGCTPISAASHFIVEMANKYAGELVYLGIGSLGNLYGAYLEDNSVFDKIKQIVLMGGITEPLFIHDGQPLDELNFKVFPEASECVLTKGKNISIITGNNCLPVSELPKNEFLDKLCSSDNPAGMYIAQKCGYRFKVKELVYGADSSNCWDAVAAAYINHPEKFTDNMTPCLVTKENIATSGFLNPTSKDKANCFINIPAPRQRVEIQELFYASWLKLDVRTHDVDFSCKGLYLDKLIQPSILIELVKEPAHGFLLLQRLKKKRFVEDSLDPTGFYRNLKKMEKDGYIASNESGDGAKSKRVYEITDFGRQSLKIWLESLKKYELHVNRIIDEINQML